MAILAKFAVSGMTQSNYDEVMRRLEAAGAGAPPGRLKHVCYGSTENLQVVDVYDGPEAFEAFGGTLVPILKELGIEAVPQVEPIYNSVRG